MPSDLIENLLQQQQELTAVEEFALRHDFKQLPAGRSIYEELIPKRTPGPGQQYAFSVDLDRCTGCKACVTACHNENGLAEDETWRTVGLLYGGEGKDAAVQHVTSACHHCIDPACLNGCPVDAYEKDPDNGIVRHLDDQCIGCQYCTFTCAYDVPKYDKKKGIVHKCDMCVSRLKVGEAPACARACPNGAIRITLVETAAVKADPDQFVRIPDAPDSHYTLPTTRYLSKKEFPAGTMSADSFALEPEHCHWPLVGMLVLTQLSVGVFLGGALLNLFPGNVFNFHPGKTHAVAAFVAGVLAMAVSVFHLGRPLYAFRSVIGLKHSWLSREIVAFGVFSFLAALYAVGCWNHFSGPVTGTLAAATAFTGILGVFCSVMVYQVTRRPFWDNPLTAGKFFLTTGILGLASVIGLNFFCGTFTGEAPDTWCLTLAVLSAGKLLMEASVLLHLRQDEWTSLRKTAFLMSRPLRNASSARFVLGALGGVILPLVLAVQGQGIPAAGWLALLSFSLLLGGEFLERFLFFRAVVPLKMPGGKVLS